MKYGWFTELPIHAFKHYGDRRIKPQGGGNPFEAIGDAFEDVGDALGDVVDGAVNIVEDAAEAVVDAVENTIESATENPLAFAAKAAAVATGQFYLLPYISAAETLDSGGSVEDALKNAAVAYAAGQVGASAAGAAGSNIAGGAAAGATGAALTGGDPVQGAMSGAINTGFNQALGAAANSFNRPTMDTGNLNYQLPEAYQGESDYSGLSGNYDVPPADYSLGFENNPIKGQAPGLSSMGGAQGLTAPTGTAIGDPNSFINNPAYYSGMPVGTISSAGFTDKNAMPALGSAGSFINNPNVTGQPVTPTPSCAYNVNLPKVDVASLLGLGQQGSMAQAGMGAGLGAGLGTTSGGESKIPWLDTRAQMLRSTPVTSRGGAQLGELKNLYQQMTPELSSVFADRGIGQGGIMTMADGGLTDSSFKEITDKFKPKFYANTAPTHLQPAGGGKRKVMGLSPLRHMYSKISEYGNMEGMAQGGLPAKYKEAAPEGHNPEFITGLTGFYANGRGTGQSDDIPAMLHDGDYVMDADTVAALGDGSSKAGAQALEQFRREVPHRMSEGGKAVAAKIADGEYVFPEAFVTALGHGDNKQGSKMLDAMRENLRAHKRSAPTSKIPPKALSPLDYLKKAKG